MFKTKISFVLNGEECKQVKNESEGEPVARGEELWMILYSEE